MAVQFSYFIVLCFYLLGVNQWLINFDSMISESRMVVFEVVSFSLALCAICLVQKLRRVCYY